MKNALLVSAVVVLSLLASIAYFKADLLSSALGMSGKKVVPVSAKANTYYHAASNVSFSYPDTYDMEERDLTYNDEQVHIVTLLPKNRVTPVNGEGGTGMTLSIFTQKTPMSLADWLQTMTNRPTSTSGGFDYQETTVGGEPALTYTATGLYESDNVALLKGSHVYVFSTTWMSRDDAILKDFSALLATVSFK